MISKNGYRTNDNPTRSTELESAQGRLSDLNRELTGDEQLSDEQAERLLRQRARELATVPPSVTDTSQVIDVVRFRLGGDVYAIGTEFVIELTRPNETLPIPQTDSFFLGITNLRGEVTAIIDLCPLLGISHQGDSNPQVLVLGRGKPEFAIAITAVEHVMLLKQNELLEPMGVTGIHAELMLGCTEDGIFVFDGDALLQNESIYVDQVD